MGKFKGIFINLEECKERKLEFKEQIKKLGISDTYERFEAIKGIKDEAESRGISCGELGLWKSWIKILEVHENAEKKEHSFIHIAEDDSVLSNWFKELMENIEEEPKWDVLATDMYVNPSIYNAWKSSYGRLLREKKLAIISGMYTGCTSSMIISSKGISKILNLLKAEMEGKDKLIPLDNMLLRLSQNGKLNIARTAPFVTTVREESISNSTIQNKADESQSIKSTQQICFYLRRQLSIFNSKKDAVQIAIETIRLAEQNEDNKLNATEKLITNMMQIIEDYRLARYKVNPNLRGEPLNRQ